MKRASTLVHTHKKFFQVTTLAMTFGIIGIATLFLVHAATPVPNAIEAEDGVVSGNATATPAAGTTAGYVTFTAPVTPPTGTWPASPAAINANICGNTAVLNGGPTSAPAGATTVPAGDNSGINFNGGGTFWFAPGTHTGISNVHPKTGSLYVGAPGAVIDGGGTAEGFLTTNWFEGSSQILSGATIRYLTIKNYNPQPQHAAVGQDGGPGLTVEYSTLTTNHRGAAIMTGRDNTIRYNCMSYNGQYAVNGYSSLGVSNLIIDHNEISYNDQDDADAATGLGASGGIKFWAVDGAVVTNNWVHHNKGGAGLWMDTNNQDFLVQNNIIESNDGKGIWYEIGFNLAVKNNSFIRNNLVSGITSGHHLGGDPEPALYLSGAGGNASYHTKNSGAATVEVSNNYFLDNLNGISLYEDGNRRCGSNDTSDCPNGATPSECSTTAVNTEPLYSKCRWQTKNVSVHDNEFHFSLSSVPACVDTSLYCGYQAIFGFWGNAAEYPGYTVSDHIVGLQNNVFKNNKYFGDWKFLNYTQTETNVSVIPWATWQAGGTAKANDGHTFTRTPQDAGSTKQ